MKLSRRTTVIILLASLGMLLVILFHAYILQNFITPVALVFWVFWRVLLMVDQKVYWGILIFAGGLYLFVRLTRDSSEAEQVSLYRANATLENVRSWRNGILLTRDEGDRPNLLKNNLRSMLSALYASKNPDVVPYLIYDALSSRDIPLPERIYTFLFTVETTGKRSFKQVIETVLRLPGKWIRHWTGRDVAEYYQTIEEVLNFMESLMEMKHDDHFDSNQH